jgi:hypothetical protein
MWDIILGVAIGLIIIALIWIYDYLMWNCQ